MKKRISVVLLCIAVLCVAETGCEAYLRTPEKKGSSILPEQNLANGTLSETGQSGTGQSGTVQRGLPEGAADAEQDKTDSELAGGAAEVEQDAVDNELPYVYINPEGSSIAERFNPPEGFARVEAEGFGAFLRAYPLLEDGAPVLLHNGDEKWNQSAHAAVFDMDMVKGDLQQCADSCIRLYAEYFYETGSYEKIAFHLTNGFLVDFDTWRKGGRVSVDGNKTEWVMNAEPSDSQEVFESYLRFVFTYAGTLSTDRESGEIDIAQIKAGDFFIKGGSPGHVVMVLDVCENETGEKAFLLGQGYMPAQQFHVLKNPLHEDDPWYYVSEVDYPFVTPEYVFAEGSFKRPVYDQ